MDDIYLFKKLIIERKKVNEFYKIEKVEYVRS
jgi:hypothetical protein